MDDSMPLTSPRRDSVTVMERKMAKKAMWERRRLRRTFRKAMRMSGGIVHEKQQAMCHGNRRCFP
jgi:hypothetical protein